MLISAPTGCFQRLTAAGSKVDFDGNVVTETDVATIKGGALIIHAGLLRARADLN